MGRRDDFTPTTKQKLAFRVGTLCSNPVCGVPTKGPHSDESKVKNFGRAAHICAAAENGPRYDASQTPEQRRDISNGIWLCIRCADEIDQDEKRYPVGVIRAWKNQAEAASQVRLETLAKDGPGLRRLLEATEELLSWPQELSDETWLQRPELEQIIAEPSDEGQAPIVLLGPPGVGKSALLARAGAVMQEKGWNVIAIKADFLPNTINTTEDLRGHLGLAASLPHVVFSLASRAPTVLLIDQLDAVSDLTDQHSGRLDVLLRTVRQTAGLPNVLIVASAREFDFDHDIRFQQLDGQRMRLAPVAEEELGPVLRKMGLAPTAVPPKLRALLRIPQWLKVFQQLNRRGINLPSTWQTLLESVWQQLVLTPSEHAQDNLALLGDLAREISEREELWVHRASVDSRSDALSRLVAAGVLSVDVTGRRVGFSHQTFYEFARVRSFLETDDLLDFVRRKEGSLFVRPVVWAALAYLREPSSQRYHQELERLWKAALRPHLRHLLIDFLGKQTDPDDLEARLLLSLWDQSKWKEAVLGAVHGSGGWFQRLKQGPLLDLMRGANASLTYAVLWSALQRSPGDTLALLRAEWFGSAARSGLLLQLLARFDSWTEEAFLQAEAALRVHPKPHEGMSMLLWGLKKQAPEYGVRLLAVALQRDLQETMRELPRDDAPADDAPPAAYVGWYLNGQPKKAISQLIGRAQESWTLIDLAEAAPVAFLENILPWMCEALEPVLSSREGWECYRDDGLLDTRPGEGGVVHELGDALKSAARRAASGSPDEFLHLVTRFQDADVGPLHLCLSFGLRELKGETASGAVDYLLGDARRFCLGDGLRQFWTSVDLLGGIAPHLTEDQVGRLEEAILELKPLPEGGERPPESRRSAQRANRQVRFHLLLALPHDPLSAATKGLLDEEKRVFPEDDRPDPIRVSSVEPTMTSAQMEKAQDQHIVRLFRELVDDSGFDHPRRWPSGGSIQAAQEFAELAKSNWRRAVGIIKELDAVSNARPIGAAIRVLAETDASTEQIVEVAQECDARGAVSVEFRDGAAAAFRDRAQKEKHLSPKAIALLEGWLKEAPVEANSSTEQKNEETEPPFLWGGSSGRSSIPDGSYWYLHALQVAFITEGQPNANEWLRVLSAHLARAPKDPAWSALLGDFRFLRFCDPVRAAEAFLDDLVDANPHFVADPEWMEFVCFASWWTDETWVRRQLDLARKVCVERAQGELLSFFAIRAGVSDELRQQMWSFLEGAPSHEFLLGAATSAAHMWSVPSARREATKVLVRMFDEGNEDIDHIIVEHALRERLAFDTEGLQVLEIMAQRPHAFLREKSGRPLERLRDLMHVRPDLLCDLCDGMVDMMESQDPTHKERWRFSQPAQELVKLALTLQRVHSCQERGLDLFERLLALGVYGAAELLGDVDRKGIDGV